ncbi:MAG: hypothetical protein CSB24_05850 [Deltaproteobacteria bacterium]|nr:MAG: hypothetical protein CSB24_05850 [Deltaproteobacteria bacterium]
MLSGKTILWWGRFSKDYSRNRILRFLLAECGYEIRDFMPKSSFFGYSQSLFSKIGRADAVWVPCFRHRDFKAAARFARKRNIPVIFDPLISAWDKAVFERKKFGVQSRQAGRLLRREQGLFSRADLVLADTLPHAEFYMDKLASSPNRTCVVPIGAEEQFFYPRPLPQNKKPEVLFYGSFINLQGSEIAVQAATLLPQIKFTLLGDGPLKEHCISLADGLGNVHFEDWTAYEKLPGRIADATLLLGIFGNSPKAGRVIANKVYQGLACGRAVITRKSEAFPADILQGTPKGLHLIPPADPKALAARIDKIISQDQLEAEGRAAARIYQQYFSYSVIRKKLIDSLQTINL